MIDEIKIVFLKRAVQWIVGGDLMIFIQDTVEAVNDSTLTGEEKRMYVFNKAKFMFSGAVSVFINLAIEVAVIAMKQRIANEV